MRGCPRRPGALGGVFAQFSRGVARSRWLVEAPGSREECRLDGAQAVTWTTDPALPARVTAWTRPSSIAMRARSGRCSDSSRIHKGTSSRPSTMRVDAIRPVGRPLDGEMRTKSTWRCVGASHGTVGSRNCGPAWGVNLGRNDATTNRLRWLTEPVRSLATLSVWTSCRRGLPLIGLQCACSVPLTAGRCPVRDPLKSTSTPSSKVEQSPNDAAIGPLRPSRLSTHQPMG